MISQKPIRPHRPSSQRAVALREVLSSIAILCLLVLAQRSTIAGGNRSSEAEVCRSNHRKLILSWLMYADDNRDALVLNIGSIGDGGGPSSGLQTWVSGWLDGTSSFDNLNTNYLVSSEINGHYGMLGPYLKHDPTVFRCPSDQTTTLYGGKRYNRVRSVSMNSWMGGTAYNSEYSYTVYKATSDINAPSGRFVITDERPDSINDSWFPVEMATEGLIDFPGNYHSGGTWMSFADGHVDYHRWNDPRTSPNYKVGVWLNLALESPGNPDMAWLRAHTTELQ